MGDGLTRWYTTPREPGAPQVGDVVVARSRGVHPNPAALVKWIGVVYVADAVRDEDWEVEAGPGPHDSWWTARVRRPTESELVIYALTGPTVPEPVADP